MRSEPTEISGITLLNKVLEFKSKISDPSKWKLKDIKRNEINLLRFKQIQILTKIFVPEVFIPNEIVIDQIIEGDFISMREKSLYKNLFLEMDKVITTSHAFLKKHKEWDANDLCFNYRDLIKYKTSLNVLLNFNDGIFETSYPFCYSTIVSGDISKNIQYESLDHFLSTVIDPEKRIFSKNQLIMDYNYPKEDVYDLELDNF